MQRSEKNIEDKFSKDKYGADRAYDVVVKNKINEIIEERKDDIVKEATTLLADKMYRSKKVREAMNEVLGDFGEK